jgi:hypothetical protein
MKKGEREVGRVVIRPAELAEREGVCTGVPSFLAVAGRFPMGERAAESVGRP